MSMDFWDGVAFGIILGSMLMACHIFIQYQIARKR